MSALDAVLILAAAAIDRLRGSAKGLPSKTLELLAYGWVIAALLDHPLDYWTPAIAALFALGGAPGWGAPMIAGYSGKMDPENLEWWQVGPLKTNAWLALTFRGAMWGAPLLALVYWLPEAALVVPAYTVAMPVAVLIAKLTTRDVWRMQELIRGGIGAGLLALLT